MNVGRGLEGQLEDPTRFRFHKLYLRETVASRWNQRLQTRLLYCHTHACHAGLDGDRSGLFQRTPRLRGDRTHAFGDRAERNVHGSCHESQNRRR
jgi:hypothetical protein